MQSPDDPLVSPYSTQSFNSSFNGSFSAPSSDPQPAPAFHRYQRGDLAAPWFATSSPEQHVPNGNPIGTSPLQQSYQVLGPYMMAEPAMYMQPVAYDSGTVSDQQIQAQFSPGMADPRTPAPSPSNNGVPAVYYQNTPAASYPAQHPVAGPGPMAYHSPGTMGHHDDYTATREGHRGSIPTLYKNNSTTSLDSMASNGYPLVPIQSAPQTFTFVTSEASSFTSDSGSQQRSQKAPKKRGSGPATRRPRKPPPEVVAEPKLQTAPEIERDAPRAGSPKRARTEASQPESKATVERTPESSRTLSPGTISKAHIGQRSRASTETSQRPSTASHSDGQRAQDAGRPQQNHAENLQLLGRDSLRMLIEQNRSLNARVDEYCRLGAELKMDLRRHERDMKCKMLEIASASAGDAWEDSPQPDVG